MSSWRDLRRFLDRHARLIRDSGDHYVYIYRYPDGTSHRITCSKGSKEIPYSKWQSILKHELKITQEEFNAGL